MSNETSVEYFCLGFVIGSIVNLMIFSIINQKFYNTYLNLEQKIDYILYKQFYDNPLTDTITSDISEDESIENINSNDDNNESINDNNNESINDDNNESINDDNNESINDDNNESINDEDNESINDEDNESINDDNNESINDEDNESINDDNNEDPTEIIRRMAKEVGHGNEIVISGVKHIVFDSEQIESLGDSEEMLNFLLEEFEDEEDNSDEEEEEGYLVDPLVSDSEDDIIVTEVGIGQYLEFM